MCDEALLERYLETERLSEEEIGGQLKAGFTLTGLYEDCDRPGCGLLREYAPQYVATRSVKNF